MHHEFVLSEELDTKCKVDKLVDHHNTLPKGPIIIPNGFADFFSEKAVIEVLGGTETEPSTQTHQNN